MTPARTVLITGAGRGLGLELVRQLAETGHRIIACVRDPARHGLTRLAGHIEIQIVDQNDPVAIAGLAARLVHIAIDLVIHCAAIRGDTGGLARFTRDDFLAVMAVNVAGPLLLTQALLPLMAQTGKVVFISSRAGSMAEGKDPDGDYAYCCSKAALNRAMVKLSDDYPQCFLALHPGWVQTDMGGPGAALTPGTSAAGLLEVITAARPDQSGSFIGYDGTPIRW